MQHGRIGRAYARLRRTFLRNSGGKLSVGEACKLGATSAQVISPQCSKACLEAQLLKGHADAGQPASKQVPRVNRKRPAEPELFKLK